MKNLLQGILITLLLFGAMFVFAQYPPTAPTTTISAQDIWYFISPLYLPSLYIGGDGTSNGVLWVNGQILSNSVTVALVTSVTITLEYDGANVTNVILTQYMRDIIGFIP